MQEANAGWGGPPAWMSSREDEVLGLGRVGRATGRAQSRPRWLSMLCGERFYRAGRDFGLLLVLGLVGCAPWQVVRIDAQPEPVRLFVDGESVAEIPAAGLRLRADRSHVLHFEREGYRAQQVILESLVSSAGPELQPGEIAVRLQPVEVRGRKIDVKLQSLQVEEGGEK